MTALRLVTDEIETETVDLTDGISRLERGGPKPGLCVDLGYGAIAKADGVLGQAGLAQRLMGHRLLLALAADTPQEGFVLPERALDMTLETKTLLDLARLER